jgi:hypothetical protein
MRVGLPYRWRQRAHWRTEGEEFVSCMRAHAGLEPLDPLALSQLFVRRKTVPTLGTPRLQTIWPVSSR